MKYKTKNLKYILRILATLTVLCIIFLVAGCNNNKDSDLILPHQQYKQPSSINTDDVLLNNIKIEQIVKYINETTEAKNSKLINSGLGIIATLLISGLIYFLKKTIDTIMRLEKTVQELITQRALSVQWENNMMINCDRNHKDLDRDMDKFDKRMSSLEKPNKKINHENN